MNNKALYALVVLAGGLLGYVVSHSLSSSAADPAIAEPGALSASAAAAAAAASSPDPASADIKLAALGGGESGVDDWAGEIRLVNFWATWCAPCRREIPLLKSIQEAQPVAGMQVIGVAFDEMDAVTSYHDEIAFNYPVLVGEQGAIAIAERYQLELMALPFTLIIGRDGELLNAHVGEIDEDEAAHIVDVLQKLDGQQITSAEAQQQLAL